MKYVDEYRDQELAQQMLHAIRAKVTRPWTLMEVCGGQTHTLVKFGIERVRDLKRAHVEAAWELIVAMQKEFNPSAAADPFS